ncbi:hypothetical protein UXP41_21065 [Enterobacter hormaechei]|nr:MULTISPECIES: hypothetical protein [Enterobacteriaceae]MDD9628183.1 hypothetical protein [Klebsiella michiganensis]MDD9634058.1 hypothetical protein [Klebsiella michiganensis]MDD9644991.1 hypothetical protein [Klebsiella michiganensis]MDD9656370.1 hypothetical protein [Klebsiella michiganensis]MEA8905090.1 hypothetical protein [Enterobacter hormaechei]
MMKNKIVHFFNGITLSHIMCIAVGVLIPIYADVLFFHGYDSSTTSAIMDTVMAIAATYTAFKVGGWLNSRLNDKAFEEANSCITSLMNTKNKAIELQQSIRQIYEYSDSRDRNNTDNTYNELRALSKKLLNEFESNITNLNSKLQLIQVWGLEIKPKKKKELDVIINSYINFLERSEYLIIILDDVNGMARKQKYEYESISYGHHIALTQMLPSKWFTSWKSLFQVSK